MLGDPTARTAGMFDFSLLSLSDHFHSLPVMVKSYPLFLEQRPHSDSISLKMKRFCNTTCSLSGPRSHARAVPPLQEWNYGRCTTSHPNSTCSSTHRCASQFSRLETSTATSGMRLGIFRNLFFLVDLHPRSTRLCGLPDQCHHFR